jgi:hypothetical protein
MECPYLAVLSAHNENGSFANGKILYEVIARIWELLDPSDIEPYLCKDAFLLFLEVRSRDVRIDGHRGRSQLWIKVMPFFVI